MQKWGSRKQGISFLQTLVILKFSTQEDLTSNGHLATSRDSLGFQNQVGEWVEGATGI